MAGTSGGLSGSRIATWQTPSELRICKAVGDADATFAVWFGYYDGMTSGSSNSVRHRSPVGVWTSVVTMPSQRHPQ